MCISILPAPNTTPNEAIGNPEGGGVKHSKHLSFTGIFRGVERGVQTKKALRGWIHQSGNNQQSPIYLLFVSNTVRSLTVGHLT